MNKDNMATTLFHLQKATVTGESNNETDGDRAASHAWLGAQLASSSLLLGPATWEPPVLGGAVELGPAPGSEV